MGKFGSADLDDNLLNEGGDSIELSVTTSGVEVKVGANPLEFRKLIIITPLSSNMVLLFNNSTTAANGIPLFKNQTIFLPASENSPVFLKMTSGTGEARIAELA